MPWHYSAAAFMDQAAVTQSHDAWQAQEAMLAGIERAFAGNKILIDEAVDDLLRVLPGTHQSSVVAVVPSYVTRGLLLAQSELPDSPIKDDERVVAFRAYYLKTMGADYLTDLRTEAGNIRNAAIEAMATTLGKAQEKEQAGEPANEVATWKHIILLPMCLGLPDVVDPANPAAAVLSDSLGHFALLYEVINPQALDATRHLFGFVDSLKGSSTYENYARPLAGAFASAGDDLYVDHTITVTRKEMPTQESTECGVMAVAHAYLTYGNHQEDPATGIPGYADIHAPRLRYFAAFEHLALPSLASDYTRRWLNDHWRAPLVRDYLELRVRMGAIAPRPRVSFYHTARTQGLVPALDALPADVRALFTANFPEKLDDATRMRAQTWFDLQLLLGVAKNLTPASIAAAGIGTIKDSVNEWARYFRACGKAARAAAAAAASKPGAVASAMDAPVETDPAI